MQEQRRFTLLPLWLCLILVFPVQAFGFSATAQVDRTRITDQEMVQLMVVVEGGEAEIDLTPIKDFAVASSGTTSSRSYVNGTWSHQTIYRYQLVPQKTGTLKIPPLTIARDGSAVTTQEILITQVRDSDAVTAFFAEAALSAHEVVTGEPAVYTLKLYAASQFSGANFTPPAFEGLTSRELTQWKKYTQTRNGQTFRVNEIRYLVHGTTGGTFDIQPALFLVQVPVARPGASMNPLDMDNFFNDSFFRTRQTRPLRVASNPVSLTVAPLPEYRGDYPFSGLVGRFTMAAKVDRPHLAVGESATLTLTIQGSGNIRDAGVPDHHLDTGQFKIYRDEPVETIQTTEKGMAGTKAFKLALVPKISGQLTIPPFHLSFFDVEARTYKTVSTPPIRLDVVPGEPMSVVQTQSPPGENGKGLPEKQEVRMKNQDILEIREGLGLLSNTASLSMPLFWGLVTVPGWGFALFALGLKLRARVKPVRRQMAEKAGALLKQASRCGPGHPDYLPLIQAALNTAILARAGRSTETLTQDEARAILQETGAGSDVADAAIQLREELDGIRFGGQAVVPETSCLDRVRSLVKVLAGAVLVVMTLVPGQARAGDFTEQLVDATRLYRAGDFKAAASGFEILAAQGIENADLFYNLGCAYLKAGDLGHAVLWYERAKRLAPLDPDLDFNLTHARRLVKDRIPTQTSLLDILFFWQGLVSLKALQIAAISFSCLFFLWAGIQRFRGMRIFSAPGLLAGALLLGTLGMTGLEAHRIKSEQYAVVIEETITVKSGTMENATPLFDLHAGTRIRVTGKKPGALKIRVTQGKVGWIPQGAAQII